MSDKQKRSNDQQRTHREHDQRQEWYKRLTANFFSWA